MASDKCLITKMLNELKTSRASIKTQTAAISDVVDKSNNVLLQIEASRSLKPASNDSNTMPYTYNKETVNALTRIVDKFMSLLTACEIPTDSSNFEEYLEAAGQRAEYLGCNVRKLLAIWDTIQQMRVVLEKQEIEINSDDEEDEDCF
ncbi:mitotic spindle density 1 [Cochliomyia hominivorax]